MDAGRALPLMSVQVSGVGGRSVALGMRRLRRYHRYRFLLRTSKWLTHRNTASQEVIMNRIRRIAAVLAGLVATVVASAVAAPAAFAMQVPPPGGPAGHPVKHAPIAPAHTHTVVIGGMPGWQITLIAAGAALAAAVLAVLLDRILTARQRVTASA
jgi:hypothetical protein